MCNFLQAGLSGRVPVIQARIRAEGRDFDEHISEFIRVSFPLTSDITFEIVADAHQKKVGTSE
jgi:hypothetical protein